MASSAGERRGLRYQNVADTLRVRIAQQMYRPGDRLPKQQDLAKSLNVSFSTLKHALEVLQDEGLIVTKPGVGTYVSEAGTVQANLWERDVRYRDLVELGSDVLWEMDVNGVYTYCSQNSVSVLGYEPTEIVGRTPFDFMSPEEAARVGEIVNVAASESKPFSLLDHEFRFKDGRVGVLECSGRPIFDGQGRLTGYRGVDRDITERARAAEELRERAVHALRLAKENELMAEISRIVSSSMEVDEVYKSFAEKIRESIPCDTIAINLLDSERGTFAAAYVDSPPGVATHRQMRGSVTEHVIDTPESVLSNDISQLTEPYPALTNLVQEGLRAFIMVPIVHRGEAIGTLQLGSKEAGLYSERDLTLVERVAGQIAGAIANSRLYAERLQAEQALREIGEGVIVTTPDGRITFVNRALAEMLGYGPTELVGEHVSKLYPGGPESPVLKEIMAQLESGPWSSEVDLARKDGDLITTLESASAVHDQAGSLTSYVCVNTDLTDRKVLEAQRRTMELKAFAQSKLATLGQVATGVAHEINQPLAFINTMIQSFQEDLELGDLDEESLKRRLGEAVRQVERINGIVTHLRTFGRADEAEMTEVSLETVLDNTLSLLGESLRLRNVRVERRVVQGVPVILGNANQLEQVFINLIQNSVDAFPDGKEDATVTVGLDSSEDGSAVKVTFSDNGVGVAPAHLARIYEPFFTTRDIGEGTGLGLSIVYGIVADHNGTIDCQSEYTKGTTFTVTLPVAGA